MTCVKRRVWVRGYGEEGGLDVGRGMEWGIWGTLFIYPLHFLCKGEVQTTNQRSSIQQNQIGNTTRNFEEMFVYVCLNV